MLEGSGAKFATAAFVLAIFLAWLICSSPRAPRPKRPRTNRTRDWNTASSLAAAAPLAMRRVTASFPPAPLRRERLDSIAGIGNGSYDFLLVTVAYAGVSSNDDPDIAWPDCAFELPATGPGFSSAGRVGGISSTSIAAQRRGLNTAAKRLEVQLSDPSTEPVANCRDVSTSPWTGSRRAWQHASRSVIVRLAVELT